MATASVPTAAATAFSYFDLDDEAKARGLFLSLIHISEPTRPY